MICAGPDSIAVCESNDASPSFAVHRHSRTHDLPGRERRGRHRAGCGHVHATGLEIRSRFFHPTNTSRIDGFTVLEMAWKHISSFWLRTSVAADTVRGHDHHVRAVYSVR